MEPRAGTFSKNANIRVVFQAGFTFHFNSSHAGRRKQRGGQKIFMAFMVLWDHAQVSHWLLCLLAQQLLSQDRIYTSVPKVMFLSLGFFKKKKQQTRTSHTSRETPKTGQQQQQKNKSQACFRGSVIPDSLGSQCHHEELKFNLILCIIVEAETNSVISSGSCVCEAAQQVPFCYSLTKLSVY